MLRVILSLTLIVYLFVVGSFSLAKDEEPAISTHGIEKGEIKLNTNPSKEQKQEWKQKNKEKKKYFKNKRNIEKQTYKKHKKQQELEYLQKRLEAKQQKLKTLNPTDKKGEKEE